MLAGHIVHVGWTQRKNQAVVRRRLPSLGGTLVGSAVAGNVKRSGCVATDTELWLSCVTPYLLVDRTPRLKESQELVDISTLRRAT
jgi:hypothetical protein